MRFTLVLAVLLLLVAFSYARLPPRRMINAVMSDMPPKLTFRCKAITPGCMGREAYDLFMTKHNALSEVMIKFPTQIRCMALTPECMGDKAYRLYGLLSDIRAPDYPIKGNDKIRYLMSDKPKTPCKEEYALLLSERRQEKIQSI